MNGDTSLQDLVIRGFQTLRVNLDCFRGPCRASGLNTVPFEAKSGMQLYLLLGDMTSGFVASYSKASDISLQYSGVLSDPSLI